MTFSEVHVESIRLLVDRSDLSIRTMRDDILDHLCCETEFRMKKGEPFEYALRETLREFCSRRIK
jgi:hypothetical protein